MEAKSVAVKDSCYSKRVVTETGYKVMEGLVPDYHSTVVVKLNEAGAIMIDKTRCHAFAYSVNEPATRSPYELKRYPGGSVVGGSVEVRLT